MLMKLKLYSISRSLPCTRQHIQGSEGDNKRCSTLEVNMKGVCKESDFNAS